MPPVTDITIEKRRPQLWRAMRHRNFKLFIAGQVISLSGTWIQSVAQSWLVYRMTGSAALLGLVGFVGQIPAFILTPLAGVIVDRVNRHHVVILTQTLAMIQAFILAYLTMSHQIKVWHLFALSAMMGLINAFDMPARQSFIVQMVAREDLINAIALNSSTVNATRIVGPALAGILVASVGEGWCFLLNAVSYLAVIAGLLAMRIEPGREVRPHATMLENLREGFSFVSRTIPVRAVLLLLGLISVMAMPYVTLMPIFASEVLHGNAKTLGILMGASGVGALLAALVLARRETVRGLGRLVAISACVFGVCLILFSQSRYFPLSVLILVPTGFSFMLQISGSNTLLQSMVPDRLRGRVMSFYSLMFIGMTPFGSLLAGLLANRIGAPWTVAIGGIASLIGGALFALNIPRIREYAIPLLVEQGMIEPPIQAEPPVPAEPLVESGAVTGD